MYLYVHAYVYVNMYGHGPEICTPSEQARNEQTPLCWDVTCPFVDSLTVTTRKGSININCEI